jgi:hypothetical protein
MFIAGEPPVHCAPKERDVLSFAAIDILLLTEQSSLIFKT